MHSDKVTATGPQKKKQNLLITANISLRLSNDLLFSFPPCHISPSGGFAAVCSVCLAAHLPLWSPVWGILLSKHCFITGFPVRLHISLSTHSGFCSSHSEKKQDLSSQIVLSLVPVLPHSPSLWFICMRDSRGTSDSHSGSADRYPALCAWACCVFLRVRQGTGGEGAEGRWRENAPGSTVSLGWNEPAMSRRTSFTNSEHVNVRRNASAELTVNAFTLFPRYAPGKVCWINLQLH